MAFKNDLEAKSIKKSAATAVRRFFVFWFEGKQHKELELPLEIHKITKQEAPQLLKRFILKIWETSKENKGKEYELGSLQTNGNGLWRLTSLSRRKWQTCRQLTIQLQQLQ